MSNDEADELATWKALERQATIRAARFHGDLRTIAEVLGVIGVADETLLRDAILGVIAKGKMRHGAEEAREGTCAPQIAAPAPFCGQCTTEAIQGFSEAEKKWVVNTAEFLAQKHDSETLAAEIKDQAVTFLGDDRVRFVLLACWRACQMSMPSLEWRRLLMTLPMEARREIMAANADWFLERLDKMEKGVEKIITGQDEDGYEGMPMEGRP